MSTVERTSRWLDKVGDWSNSILVKETRQALKSRQFLITFMLLLTASWAISAFGLLMAGNAIEYGREGGQFFYIFYVVLLVAILIIVPHGAFRSLLSEQEQNTFELLSITSLSPKQIVWGKLLSALVQVFIYYSAIAPFIAFTSHLPGFEYPAVAYLLVVSVLASLGLSMMALMFATTATQRQWQALNSVAVLGGLLFGFFFFLTVAMAIMRSGATFEQKWFWWANGFGLVAFASYFILCRQITTAQLTFQSDNRSTGIRLTCAAQLLLAWTGLSLYLLVEGHGSMNRESVLGLVTLSTIHLSIVGLFVTAEPDFLSRRVRRSIPANPLWRLFVVPFFPGGGRGYLYIVLQAILVCVTAIVVLAAAFDPPTVAPTVTIAPVEYLFGFIESVTGWLTGDPDGPQSAAVRDYLAGLTAYISGFLTGHEQVWTHHLQVIVCVACYVVIYVGLAAILGRWGRALSSEIKPAHIRVIAFLVFLTGAIGPYIPITLFGPRMRYQLFAISNPFTTIWEIESRKGQGGIINFFSTAWVSFQEHSSSADFSEAVRLTWSTLHGTGDSGIVMLLTLGAGCMLLVNLPAVKNSVQQIWFREAVPVSRRQRRRTDLPALSSQSSVPEPRSDPANLASNATLDSNVE